MKKYALFVISILALVVLASGCTTSSDQTSTQPTVPTQQYSANGISVSYPESWKELQQVTSPNAVVAFGDPNSVDKSTENVNTLVVVQKVAMPSGATLKQVYDSTYQQYAEQNPSFKTVSESTRTVDGTTAYVNVHTVDVSGVQKQEEEVWLEKNGNVYVILCGALPSEFQG